MYCILFDVIFNTNYLMHVSYFRITSSNFGRIIHLRDSTEPEPTIKQILYSDVRNRYTEWGLKHEAAARMKYKIIMNKE